MFADPKKSIKIILSISTKIFVQKHMFVSLMFKIVRVIAGLVKFDNAFTFQQPGRWYKKFLFVDKKIFFTSDDVHPRNF